MLIADFYKNREIFITGGTGFLGKSLIEKLLRDCPDISKIYMLIRSKKGKTAKDRLEEFSNNLIFERLHRERPNAFEKVIPIVGDSFELGMGISEDDLERMKNVSIIFHGAANVRFDNNLRGSLLMNSRGTHELIKIALNLKSLLAFIHISTAYINPSSYFIEERLYDTPINWRSAIKMAETCDEETLEIFKLKYSNFYPNAYSYTKNVSEHIIAEYSDRLPIIIMRPSIVTSSLNEPEAGFIDNFNGPIGLLVGIALGITRVGYCNSDMNLALIPVDYVSIYTVIAGYKRGLETLKSKTTTYELDIRNLTPGKLYPFSLKQAVSGFLQYADNNPFQYSIWAPTNFMTANSLLYLISIIFLSIPMALLYDGLLLLFKKDTMILKLTRKTVYASFALGKFSKETFYFQNDGMWDLVNYVPEEEMKLFGYIFQNNPDYHSALTHSIFGVKKYIFKEPIHATPATHLRYKVLVILDKTVKLLIFLCIIKYLWKLIN